MRKTNETKTTKNSLGFTGVVETEKNKTTAGSVAIKAKKTCDADIVQRALECGAYFKKLQKQDILEQSANARVYNALLEGIVIKYAKAYADSDTMHISVNGLTAVVFSLGRLRQANILTDINIDIQDTSLAGVHYTVDITAINPYKLREIAETYKLALNIEFPEDTNDGEPEFSW